MSELSELSVPVSFGELLDKISILEIKSERITAADKLANVRRELAALDRAWRVHPASARDVASLRADLKTVNGHLWDSEDAIRMKEQAQTFDDEFIAIARSIYRDNDRRAQIKKQLNLALGSGYIEEKSY